MILGMAYNAFARGVVCFEAFHPVSSCGDLHVRGLCTILVSLKQDAARQGCEGASSFCLSMLSPFRIFASRRQVAARHSPGVSDFTPLPLFSPLRIFEPPKSDVYVVGIGIDIGCGRYRGSRVGAWQGR